MQLALGSTTLKTATAQAPVAARPPLMGASSSQQAPSPVARDFKREARQLRNSRIVDIMKAVVGIICNRDELKFGQRCHLEKTPNIRGTYWGSADWAGSGCVEIEIKKNSASCARGEHIIVQRRDLKPGF